MNVGEQYTKWAFVVTPRVFGGCQELWGLFGTRKQAVAHARRFAAACQMSWPTMRRKGWAVKPVAYTVTAIYDTLSEATAAIAKGG